MTGKPDSVVSLGTVPGTSYRLQWISRAVANIMDNNGIRSRRHLAQVLGMSHDSIYNTFPEDDWTGDATLQVLAQIAGTFGVKLGDLVTEPMHICPQNQTGSM